jgi:hypothetical protein
MTTKGSSSGSSSSRSSSGSGSSSLNDLQNKYGPSSNYNPWSGVPNTSIGDVQRTIRESSYDPIQAATTAAGIQAAAARGGETTARNAFGYGTAVAAGRDNPWSDANWTKNTQALNQGFAQRAEAQRDRLMQAGLTKEETKRQQYAQDIALAAAKLGAQSTLGAAEAQSRATVEAARAQASAQRAIAASQIEAARINAQTGLIGNIFGSTIGGLVSNYSPQTQYWGG